MIGLSKRAMVEGIAGISSDWVGFAFTGTKPEREADFNFDPKDDSQLYENSVAMFEMSSTLRADHIKFYGVGGSVPFKGVSDIETSLGHRVIPNVIRSNIELNLFDRMLLASGQLGMNKPVDVGSYLEYQFDACKVSSIRIEANNKADGEVEYHDGSDWVHLHTVVNSGTLLNIAGPEQEIFGIRLVATSMVQWRVDAIDVYAESQSSNGSVKSPITWVVLLPVTALGSDHRTSGNYPYLYLPVGGPNSEEPMMLNTINPDYGQEVKLLYFTLGSGLMEF